MDTSLYSIRLGNLNIGVFFFALQGSACAKHDCDSNYPDNFRAIPSLASLQASLNRVEGCIVPRTVSAYSSDRRVRRYCNNNRQRPGSVSGACQKSLFKQSVRDDDFLRSARRLGSHREHRLTANDRRLLRHALVTIYSQVGTYCAKNIPLSCH